jgi:hypothetical protein
MAAALFKAEDVSRQATFIPERNRESVIFTPSTIQYPPLSLLHHRVDNMAAIYKTWQQFTMCDESLEAIKLM